VFLVLRPLPRRSPPFPYTTLFRNPRRRQVWSLRLTSCSRRPRSCQPDRELMERLASAILLTPDTLRRRGWAEGVESSSKVFGTEKERHAPAPGAAHQRRHSAGAETRPTFGTPSSSRLIRVAHTGTPRTKFFVPSIGSMTHWRPSKCASPPNSSP